jgi:hypothetical protein
VSASRGERGFRTGIFNGSFLPLGASFSSCGQCEISPQLGAHRLNVHTLQAFRLTKPIGSWRPEFKAQLIVLRWTELPTPAVVSQMKSMAGPIQIRSPDGPAPKERDPHSERVIFDMAEWHDRLERLADMRRGLPAPGGVDKLETSGNRT